jgi:hypothetical protein
VIAKPEKRRAVRTLTQRGGHRNSGIAPINNWRFGSFRATRVTLEETAATASLRDVFRGFGGRFGYTARFARWLPSAGARYAIRNNGFHRLAKRDAFTPRA